MAKILGIVLVVAACPTWLAAQGLVPSGNPPLARPAAPLGSPLPGNAAPAGPFAPSRVRPASFESPVAAPASIA